METTGNGTGMVLIELSKEEKYLLLEALYVVSQQRTLSGLVFDKLDEDESEIIEFAHSLRNKIEGK